MKLNVYKNQKEIEKTFEVKEYDLMYGTIEDLLAILDEVEDTNSDAEIFKVVAKNRGQLNRLLLDVFGDEGLIEDDLRNIKIKELVPFFVDLFAYVRDSLSTGKN